ncbi:hypothetical protein VTN96DRAFT_55 [Rasamsonia emersonii]
MWNRRRNVDAPSDERRLFPNYERSRDEVPIIPGRTFSKPAKPLQSFAQLKPVDTLSRKSRESGPVRAQGKSKPQVDDQSSPAPRSPQVNDLSDFDDSERPVKRQRRDVINLVDDEDAKRRTSSPTLSPEASRQHRLSSASSQSSARGRKPPESKNVCEYRGVEKMMTSALRGSNNKQSPQKKQELLSDDGRGEPSAHNMKHRHLQSPISDDETASARLGHRTKRPVFESVEIRNSPNGIGARSGEESPRLQKLFVPTDGKRRTSDMRESPDELQGEATVQPAPSSLSVNYRRDHTSESRSSDRSEKDARKGTQRISPSDIKPTTFTSSRQSEGKKQRKLRKVTSGKSHVRLFEASLFRFGSVERVASEKQAFDVGFDSSNETIGLAAVSETEVDKGATIPVRKVALALQGMDGSRKVRLKLSKTEGAFDETVDIEFQSEKDKLDLCNLLETKGVKIRKKESGWMDKIFENSRKAEPRQINRCKRPSPEASPDSVSEPKVEHVKRPKLSASLQGDDDVVTTQPAGAAKQQPRRLPDSSSRDQASSISPAADTHSHPAAKEDDSGTPVSVKKFTSPSSEGRETRETRSKARRGLVSLISDDGASSPKSKSNDSLPKWSRPLVYPREGKKKAEVDRHDFERLRDGEFLNDNLIGFYLRFLEDHLERNNPEVSKRTYFFNSYFFATLTNTPRGKRGINYEGVQKWTRNVDLFSRDYVIVPINESAHWYLAIICNLSSLLRKKEESAEPGEPAPDSKDVPSQSPSEVKEIPETPQNVPVDESGNATEVAEPEETTRQSFASMTLSDTAPTDGAQRVEVSEGQSPESDDDWPEKEENPTSSPPRFSRAGDGSRSADRDEAEQTAEKSKDGLAQETKEKRKSRSKHDVNQPAIITFDSLGASRYPAIKVLRAYLLEEAMSKRSLQIDPKDIKGITAGEIPLQPNFSDCGLYLLAYLEKFAQDPDGFVEKSLQREMNAQRDWPPLKSGLLRRRLRDFLYRLQEEQENIQRNKVSGGKTLVDEKPISFLLGHAQASAEQHEKDSVRELEQELERELSEKTKSSMPAEVDVTESVHETRSKSHRPDETSRSRTGDTDAQHSERRESTSSVEEETDLPEVVKAKQEESSRSPSSVTREARHKTPDEKWVDELFDLTASPKRVKVEVQVPGTPPSSSRSGAVLDSPRSSPKQVKSRNKNDE